MANNAQDVLNKARGELGYYAPNDPLPGSKYGRWMADATGERWLAGPSTSVWWCMIFVSWCFDQAGANFGALPSYNCDATIGRVRNGKGGTILNNKQDAQPGDIVFYDWGKDGRADHVGIVELNGGSYVQAIEGNTSPGTAGSQSAGNGTYRRTRAWSNVICVVRPPYGGASTQPTGNGGGSYTGVAPYQPASSQLTVDGDWGKATFNAIAKVFGTPQDGVMSHQYRDGKKPGVWCAQYDNTQKGSTLIHEMQKWLGIVSDGLLGMNTIKALQMKMGTPIDGVLSSGGACITEMQKRLNAGTFK